MYSSLILEQEHRPSPDCSPVFQWHVSYCLPDSWPWNVTAITNSLPVIELIMSFPNQLDLFCLCQYHQHLLSPKFQDLESSLVPLSYALTNAKHLDCSCSPGGMPICQCYTPFITLYHPSPSYLKVEYFYLIPTHSPTPRFLSQDTLRALWLLCVYSSSLSLFYLAKGVLYYPLQWNHLFSLKEYDVEPHYMRLSWNFSGWRWVKGSTILLLCPQLSRRPLWHQEAVWK